MATGKASRKVIAGMAFAAACALFADPVKTYSHPMDPRLHPDDARRLVKPPDAKTFNNRLQFMALRSMSASGYKDALDRYVVRDRLGDIIWAHSGMIFNKNVREQAEELKRRGRHIADIVEYLAPNDLLVVNDTKVFPARLIGTWADTPARWSRTARTASSST